MEGLSRLQSERPDSGDSEGSFHSPSSIKSYYAGSDEYDDVYTNESTIKENEPDINATEDKL